MCNLSWTPYSNLEKDNSLKTTPVLAQRWAVWSILTKKKNSRFAALWQINNSRNPLSRRGALSRGQRENVVGPT